MRILFVYPLLTKFVSPFRGITLPVSVLQVASFVQAKGHTVQIADRNVQGAASCKRIERFKPDAIAFTVMFTHQIQDFIAESNAIRRKYPELPILSGGLTATLLAESIIKDGNADYVGLNEGEYTLLELLEVISGKRTPDTVQSLVYRTPDGEIVQTAQRSFVDLADFPLADYSLLPMDKYAASYPGVSRAFPVIASKGCPAACTFCVSKAYNRGCCRQRSRESVMQEIRTLVTEYDADGIIFYDETFGVDKAALEGHCADFIALRTESGKPIKWLCESRIGVLTRDDLDRMANAGCIMIQFGIENGSPEILQRIKKGYNPAKVETDIRNCKSSGIRPLTSLILGFPDETEAQIRQTIHLIFRLNTETYSAGYYYASLCSEDYNRLVAERRLVPVQSLSKHKKTGNRYSVDTNYAAIPTKELKVIFSFFNWVAVFHKQVAATDKGLYLLRTAIPNILRNIRKGGFLLDCFQMLLIFLNAAWCIHAYPQIRNKYDLYSGNFGRADWSDLAYMDE
ncbi:MAG: B12-binding domain-containing radical SAM protein [Oscillospiraceae bacterium]|jgi:radical SAM superfamily enzyme YgiQ (UPF0313 family)|nr:B12-binding domain-containing radical SAM protein [Oscillospiraceae bacterium]